MLGAFHTSTNRAGEGGGRINIQVPNLTPQQVSHHTERAAEQRLHAVVLAVLCLYQYESASVQARHPFPPGILAP